MATPIDLSQLPYPGVVETLDFETIFARRKASFLSRVPAEQRADYAATLELESEPVTMLLQDNAYQEIVWRQRVNDAARANFLAFAKRADLDNLVALLGVQRLVITEADPENEVEEVKEGDPDLLKRAQLAPLGFSVAGPAEAYKSHALGADGAVLDVAITSPSPGVVLVTVLARDGDGTASPALLSKVFTTLNADDVRPLTDQVLTQSADIVGWALRAKSYYLPGPDMDLVRKEQLRLVNAYAEACRQIGRDVAISGIMAALHIAGVDRVELESPLADVLTTDVQAPFCTAIELLQG